MSRQTDEMRNYFDANGIALKDVAEAIGVQPSSVSNMLADRDKIGKIRAKRLRDAYGFDYLFLLTGEGELFPAVPPHSHQVMKVGVNKGSMSQSSGNCPDVSELLAKIDKLTEDLKAKENENAWLRSLVDRLAPEGK